MLPVPKLTPRAREGVLCKGVAAARFVCGAAGLRVPYFRLRYLLQMRIYIYDIYIYGMGSFHGVLSRSFFEPFYPLARELCPF